MFLSDKTPLVAIDIGSNSIKLAQLAGKRDQYELLSFGVMPLPNETIVDGVVKNEEVVIDALAQLVRAEKIQTKYAVASVAGEAVIVKKIRVPVMTEAQLALSIKHEAEQYIPFDIEEVSIDFQILGKSKSVAKDAGHEEDSETEKMEVLLVAVQRGIIDSRRDILRAAGLKPAIIDLDVFAIVNAMDIQRESIKHGATALIDLGATFTHLNILLNGQTAFTRDIPLGGVACTQKLMSDLAVEYPVAEAAKQGELPEKVEREKVVHIIVDAFGKIVEELEKSLEFFGSTANVHVDKALICGGGALIRGADGLLAEKLKMPVSIMNPLEGIKINPRKFDAEHIASLAPLTAVALGLATRKFDYM